MGNHQPQRIQRRRSKGWTMPPNTVYVGRPSKWGNPFSVRDAEAAGLNFRSAEHARAVVVRHFRWWLDGDRVHWMGKESDAAAAAILNNIHDLRGKNLACWCPLDGPCHADVLLELANEVAAAESVLKGGD